MNILLRAVGLTLILLTGCDDESAERRTFIDFLRTRIIDRTGVHIPLMNAETAKTFGPYASHYQIILDFNSGLDLSPLERVASLKGRVRDLNDLVAHRAELKTLHEAIPGMIALCENKISAANAAHAALQQPGDLKAVYDKAFDRIVTRPGTLLLQMLGLLDKNVAAMVALTDYIAEHSFDITIQGMDATSKDTTIGIQVRELLETLHQHDTDIEDLERQFQQLVSGT
jgi:hypothetical protein